MKLKCPYCGKTCVFEYWERQTVDTNYPLDEEGHVLWADGSAREEFVGEVAMSYLECMKCGACFSAKQEACNEEQFDLKVSLGKMTQKGTLHRAPTGRFKIITLCSDTLQHDANVGARCNVM